jgi:hypothetical protein
MANEQEMRARIAELEAKLAEANKPKALSIKIGEKGGIVVAGLNARFPVTLYADQWARLAAFMPTVLEFAKKNAADLAVKGTPYVPKTPATVKA